LNVWLLRRKNASFAVGHMALAYLLGKPSAKILKVNLNIPLILVLSLLPDIDILAGVSGFHRGPTHSIIAALIVFIPVFAIYRRKAVPYFIALASHSLIADFCIGGKIQLLWPLSLQSFGLHEIGGPYISIWNPINIALEWTLFVISTIIMFKTRDLLLFFQNKKSNLLLTIPIITVLLPTFVSYPLQVPILLIPPHVFYLLLFSVSVLITILRIFKKPKSINKPSP
jgi:membrane-bound metal-dependent hydrolase YbcI (DUF457 family)